MKLTKSMIGLLIGGLFVSCSDDIVQDTPNNETLSSGYISIALGMPSGPITRANDQFDDGLAGEYTVNSIGILFFEGREENARFSKAYSLTASGFESSSPVGDQISSLKALTFPVDITNTPESLWALAVINYGQLMTINSDNSLTVQGQKFEGDIAEFLEFTTPETVNLYNRNGQDNFFMTNAPYTTAPGTGNTAPSGFVHLLASVDKEKIMETEAQAKQNPAAEIFVERAVAKVEVIIANTDEIVAPNLGLGIESVEWVLDNTEPTSYYVRRLSTSTDNTFGPVWLTYTQATTPTNAPAGFAHYRFVGNTPFAAGKDMYRLYYGIDPNGNGVNEAGKLKVLTDAENGPGVFKETGAGKPQYCLENTFDVDHMDYMNTTRAILKVKYAGGDFYTRGIDRVTKYTFDNAAAAIAHYVLDNPDVIEAFTTYNTEEAATVTIADLAYTSSSTVKTAKNNWLNLTYGIDNGRLVLTNIVLFNGKGQAEANKINFAEGVNIADVVAQVNGQVTFNAYTGGVAYYAVRIKHFGDDMTPWNEPVDGENNPIATPTTTEAYGTGLDASKNFLGRYGVLRNNWYQLNVTDISKIGEPTLNDLPLDKTPDDKNDPEKSIACKVNILSWAKRSQNVDL